MKPARHLLKNISVLKKSGKPIYCVHFEVEAQQIVVGSFSLKNEES
jgi:hypothetical protein